jgi:DNA ligase-1
MKTFKPMLAAAIIRPSDSDGQLDENLKSIQFPVIASPKLDGIRCVTMPWVPEKPNMLSVPVCRSLKQVPNDHIRHRASMLPPGLDGEVMTYDHQDLFIQPDEMRPRNFHAIQSDVMTMTGVPNFRFHVFDYHDGITVRYHERLAALNKIVLPDWVVIVPQVRCRNIEDLQSFMAKSLANGHEGICFRKFDSPYKYGRSTLKQQWLIKWKLFHTSEATIIGIEEEMHNNNPPTIGLLGHQERSSHQENLSGKDRLGALVVKMRDIEFKIGTGFTAQQRLNLWQMQGALIGKLVTFKHQLHGAKEAPRIPVFVGIRDIRDL